jgi:hypothetical protein
MPSDRRLIGPHNRLHSKLSGQEQGCEKFRGSVLSIQRFKEGMRISSSSSSFKQGLGKTTCSDFISEVYE